MEGVLSKAMGEDLYTWKSKLSTTKTVSAVFHLNNKEAIRVDIMRVLRQTSIFHSLRIPRWTKIVKISKISEKNENKFLKEYETKSACFFLTQFTHTLHTSHLQATHTLSTFCGIHREHISHYFQNHGNSRADPFNSRVGYCAPAWCRSAHTRLIDPVINDALPILTGCLRPTPASNLPILAGIQPDERRRKEATLSLARLAMEPGHLLRSALICLAGTHDISNRDTHLCPPHNNSSIHLTTTEVRCSGRITDEMRGDWRTIRDRTFNPRHRHPPSRNGPAKNNLGQT